MKLNDLDTSKVAQKALKSNFNFELDTNKLDRNSTKRMMEKVYGLIKEAKDSPNFYANEKSPTYMKLVFMAQALTEHYKSFKAPRIVTENTEVQKSEVILAAQDMINSVQKMIEEVNDMLVKELPALTDSIQAEIGVNESSAFNQSASQALTTLNQTLSQSKTDLQTALNQMTGQGAGEAFGAPAGGEEMAVTDIATKDAPGGEEMVGAELDAELPAPDADISDEEPEAPPVGGAGRAKR
jgi:hypothetical protein